jgi:hypothetical protein
VGSRPKATQGRTPKRNSALNKNVRRRDAYFAGIAPVIVLAVSNWVVNPAETMISWIALVVAASNLKFPARYTPAAIRRGVQPFEFL